MVSHSVKVVKNNQITKKMSPVQYRAHWYRELNNQIPLNQVLPTQLLFVLLVFRQGE